MPIVREYAMQSIFAAAQSLVILTGSIFTATVLKSGHGARSAGPWLPVFVRDWGFVLMLIPATWVFLTLWLERHRSDWFTKRWTVLSGVLLLAVLAWLMVTAVAIAGAAPRR